MLDVLPVSFFGVRVGLEFTQFLGGFGFLQTYDSADAPYDDKTREDEASFRAHGSIGTHFFVEPSLQFKFGPLALRSKWSFERYDLALGDADSDGIEDTVFYDAPSDALVGNGRFVWSNETTALFLRGKLVLGLQYTSVHPLYGPENFGGVLPENPRQTDHRRIGPLFAWSFNTREFGGFNRPTALLILGHYLNHPYREGWSSPYVLLGFGFGMDFLKPHKG